MELAFSILARHNKTHQIEWGKSDMTESLSPGVGIRLNLRCGDGDISFLRWPNNGPRLHFAHANGFNAETYRPLLQDLSKDYEVLASDFRGHGQSTLNADPKQMTSWLRYRDDLIAFLEATGPSTLVGHSMGATTSVLAAALRPELVDRLVLLDPVTLPPVLGQWWRAKAFFTATFRAESLSNPLSRAALKRRNHWPTRDGAYNHFSGRGMFKSWQSEFVQSYLDGGLRELADGSVELACAPEWESANFSTLPIEIWRAAKKIKCPATLICGERHSTCPPPRSQRLSQVLKSSQTVVIKGTSHFLPMERPDLIIREIRAN